MEIILAAAAGLIVGALAAVLFAKGRQQALKTEAAILRSRLDDALRKAEQNRSVRTGMQPRPRRKGIPKQWKPCREDMKRRCPPCRRDLMRLSGKCRLR